MQLWVDVPVGTQRILLEAADRCHLSQKQFLRLLLIEASAEALAFIEPDHKFYDLRRQMGIEQGDAAFIASTHWCEESTEGGSIDTAPVGPSRHGGARRNGRSLRT